MNHPCLSRLATALFVCALATGYSSCALHSALPTPNARSPVRPGMASATFTMHWPTTTSSTSSTRQPFFISPSAQSVTISVNGQTPNVVNRPSGSPTPTSNITIAAPVGTDVFSIKLYDQQGGSGNLLGQTALSKTIVANAANTISATVNAVLGKIALGPASAQPFVEGNAVGGFVLVGLQALTFIATPEDADGNAIVAPGTIPVISLAASSSGLKITPTSTTNQFKLQVVTPLPSSPFSPPLMVTLLATSKGTPISATFSITESSAIYVPNFGNSSITFYDHNGIQITLSGAFPNLNGPSGIAFDSANGQLYVTNFSNSTITVYNQSGGKITTSGTFPNLNSPQDIAFDQTNGELYATNEGNNTITVYDKNGNQITPSGAFPNLNGPQGILFDPANGQLYVTNSGNNSITVYDQNGNQITPSGTFPGLNGPADIALDQTGSPFGAELFVPNFNNNTLNSYDPNGNVISCSVFPNLNGPAGIAFDQENSLLYVTNEGNNTITGYNTCGDLILSGAFPNLSTPAKPAIVP